MNILVETRAAYRACQRSRLFGARQAPHQHRFAAPSCIVYERSRVMLLLLDACPAKACKNEQRSLVPRARRQRPLGAPAPFGGDTPHPCFCTADDPAGRRETANTTRSASPATVGSTASNPSSAGARMALPTGRLLRR